MRDPKELTEARLADAQRVLVVDDEESILALLEQFFSRLGYECLCFTDAQEALEYADSHHCDLIITDMVMPLGLSGLQLVEEMTRRHPNIPVIVMTGYPIIEAVTRCLQAGASAATPPGAPDSSHIPKAAATPQLGLPIPVHSAGCINPSAGTPHSAVPFRMSRSAFRAAAGTALRSAQTRCRIQQCPQAAARRLRMPRQRPTLL